MAQVPCGRPSAVGAACASGTSRYRFPRDRLQGQVARCQGPRRPAVSINSSIRNFANAQPPTLK